MRRVLANTSGRYQIALELKACGHAAVVYSVRIKAWKLCTFRGGGLRFIHLLHTIDAEVAPDPASLGHPQERPGHADSEVRVRHERTRARRSPMRLQA